LQDTVIELIRKNKNNCKVLLPKIMNSTPGFPARFFFFFKANLVAHTYALEVEDKHQGQLD
jgi:hypothetical protein